MNPEMSTSLCMTVIILGASRHILEIAQLRSGPSTCHPLSIWQSRESREGAKPICLWPSASGLHDIATHTIFTLGAFRSGGVIHDVFIAFTILSIVCLTHVIGLGVIDVRCGARRSRPTCDMRIATSLLSRWVEQLHRVSDWTSYGSALNKS